ncbi:F0F1 ATP synthase subunit alpha [Patescibacteria group bacterium]
MDFDFQTCLQEIEELGYVQLVKPPVVQVQGLPGARPRELVLFESGGIGYVLGMTNEYVEVLLLGDPRIGIGSKVARTNKNLTVPVHTSFLGQSLNPLCEGSGPFPSDPEFRAVDVFTSPEIAKRSRITKPFLTGVTLVDLMIPLGRGQRELVVGDRKIGKTEFLLQTMLKQAKEDVICIYASIAKRKADIRNIEDFAKEEGIMDKLLMVISASTDPLGLIYITPYTAMALAEYFKDQGHDVLLILDDLTTHAKFYREISLVNNKFPGRGSYPGDIFYTHARLLERAGNFKTDKGPKSITCLVVAETVEGDISGYIQTNLMAITDGHIFFDKDYFEEGRRPAINHFLSVTRVGRQTQSRLRWGG